MKTHTGRPITIAVINVPTKVGPKDWETCFRRTARRAAIFGVNETFTEKAKLLYRDLAREMNLGRCGLRGGPDPIFWDRDIYRQVEHMRTRLHVRGSSLLARRWPGFNEARYVNEAVLRHRATGDQQAILCTHWVPEGRKVPAAWRKWARAESRRRVRALAVKHLAEGRPVWLLGDTNIGAEFNFKPIPGATFRWVRGKGIDKIGLWLPKGMAATDVGFELYDAPTDHKHGVAAHATLVSA